jgi:hypothetical protein
MKAYALDQLNAASLQEIAAIHYERPQPDVWEELARHELSERDRSTLALILAKLREIAAVFRASSSEDTVSFRPDSGR